MSSFSIGSLVLRLKGQNVMFFLVFFLFNSTPLGWNVLESERPLRSWRHKGWRNTKTCIHQASGMERKRGKCSKLQIFECKLWFFVGYLSEMKTVIFLLAIFLYFLQLVSPIYLFWRYLNSNLTSFPSDILLPFPSLNDLNSSSY